MKIIKYLIITLVAVVVLVAAVLGVAVYCVVTPERLTTIVQTEVKEQLGFDVKIKNADITLFSSFPEVQIKVDSLDFSPIATVGTFAGRVDIERFIDSGDIVINKLYLSNARFDICTDTLAKMGFINTNSTEEQNDAVELFNQNVLITEVELDDIKVNYLDSMAAHRASVAIPKLVLSGSLKGDSVDMCLLGGVELLSANIADTIKAEGLNLSQLDLEVTGSLKENIFNIATQAALEVESVVMNGEKLLEEAKIVVDLPACVDLDNESAIIDKSYMSINDLSIALNGNICNQKDNNLLSDLHLTTNRWDFNSLIALVPESYTKPYKANIRQFKSLGGALQVDIHAFVDLSKAKATNLKVNSAKVELGDNTLNVWGKVDDALNSVNCDLNIDAKGDLEQLLALAPASIRKGIEANGKISGSFNSQFKLADLTSVNLEKIKAQGVLSYNGLYLNYNDSLNVVDNCGKLDFVIAKEKEASHLIDVSFSGDKLLYNQLGVGKSVVAKPQVRALLSNPLDTTKILDAKYNYSVEELKYESDSIKAHIINADGKLAMYPDKIKNNVPVMTLIYHSDSLTLNMEDAVSAKTGNITVKARSSHDASQERLLLKWNPLLSVDFNNGAVNLADVNQTIYIPAIKFDYRSEDINIYDSRVIIEDSDFSLSGKIGNIKRCIRGEDKLVGELNYYSKHTDIDQIMALSDHFTSQTDKDTAQVSDIIADTTTGAPHPFMVPKMLNVALNTEVESAIFSGSPIYDIKGRLVVNNGELIMDQVGLRSEAAKMYLTAIYRPERENHLYAGLNFHLVDVDIDALVDIVPSVDTLMPMLQEFEGKAEFHLAVETYLTGFYQPKVSTLRGAMAIKGKDLVLLDGETFEQASKLLMFSRKARNVIDSLSVEATLFRDQVDVYPFLLSMDRWQAVLSGRHNMDMNFNYHVSVVDCPVPIKLGVDIKGGIDNMKIKLAPCKYKALYKPKKQGAMEKQILEFKGIVSNSLIKNLKSREDYKSGL